MKGKMILAITTAILALALTIWCFIDGTYYIGVFALFICIAQVCNFFLIKKKKYWYKNAQKKIDNRWLNKKYVIETGEKSKDGKQIASEQTSFIAADNMEYAVGNKIPLWAFGFLYWINHLLCLDKYKRINHLSRVHKFVVHKLVNLEIY